MLAKPIHQDVLNLTATPEYTGAVGNEALPLQFPFRALIAGAEVTCKTEIEWTEWNSCRNSR